MPIHPFPTAIIKILGFMARLALSLILTLGILDIGQSASTAHAGAGPQITQAMTSHGARLLVLQAPSIPIVDLAIEIDAGSRWDPVGKEGLATMTAGMLFRGLRAEQSEPALDEQALGRIWADLALERSGGASQDRTSLRFRFLSDPEVRLPASQWIGRVLAHPAFDGQILAREQARAVAGLKDALNRPQTLASRALWQAMYPGHAYGRHESIESLSALTTADLQSFHRQFWQPERITVVVVGALSVPEAKDLADKILGPLSQTAASGVAAPTASADAAQARMPAVLAPVRMAQQGARVDIDHAASQSHIWMGMPMLARHERNEFFTALVANHILGGGGFTSRLTQEVREKRGLSYSVFSAVSPLAQPGPFVLGLQTQRDKSQEALEVVRATLEAYVRDGPTDEEIEAAKKNLLGGFALRLDSNRKLLDTLAQMGFYRLPVNYLDTWTDAVSLVTKEDIRVFLQQRLVLSRLNTVVVAGGPQ
jgi:zinc protease